MPERNGPAMMRLSDRREHPIDEHERLHGAFGRQQGLWNRTPSTCQSRVRSPAQSRAEMARMAHCKCAAGGTADLPRALCGGRGEALRHAAVRSSPAGALKRFGSLVAIFVHTSPPASEARHRQPQARRFFSEASSSRCRRSASAMAARRPPGARELVWINPDGVTEEDVFLLRARMVYRFVDVRPQHGESPSRAEDQVGLTTDAELACTLPDAHCSRRGR
jgi:hypothetical protein